MPNKLVPCGEEAWFETKKLSNTCLVGQPYQLGMRQ